MFGITLTPDDLFKVARDGEVVVDNGQRFKQDRPLDWVSITDHAEYMGISDQIRDGSPELLANPQGKRWYEMANRLWHSDSSFKRTPAKASLLYAHTIPPVGGQTEYADMRAAYDALGEAGDLPLPNTSLAAMGEALTPQVERLIRAHHMVWLGGDHSITLPLLRAYREVHGRPLAAIHFDAHCDTWEDHFGEPSGHGTWVYEAIQEGLVIPECFTQLGIRSAGVREARDYVRDQGGQIFTARELRCLDNALQLAPALASIRERRAAHGQPPVYLSLDIDCLDPAFAPGTGTPEPGGLSTNQVLTILEELADLPFVGMDCVEVAPPYDHAELTSQAAAAFVWTYLCGRIARGKAG